MGVVNGSATDGGVRAQPGVEDESIKQLVDEKVNAFWKGVEGDANKRGQVRSPPLLRPPLLPPRAGTNVGGCLTLVALLLGLLATSPVRLPASNRALRCVPGYAADRSW